MTDYPPELVFLVRMLDPAKLLPPLPGIAAVLPALVGVPAAVIADVRSHIEDRLDEAADELLQDDAVKADLARLTNSGTGSIAGIGDSLTADRLGWFALLERLCAKAESDIDFTNFACAGETSTQMLARLPAIARTGADLVLCLPPSNDVRRFGRNSAPTQMSSEESQRALALCRDECLRVSRRFVFICAPGIEERAAQDSPFWQEMGVHWRAGDLDTLAAAVLALDGAAIDLRTALAGQAGMREPDGLHLTPGGAVQAVKHILARAAW